MDYKQKYLKYKEKYLKYKEKYISVIEEKPKYIDIVEEKPKCGNFVERIFENKIKCENNEYCECESCKLKKKSGEICKHNYECDSYNCELNRDKDNKLTDYGKCSSQVSILKELFLK